ncbi:hypothetical protein R9C00_15820 [Flammeovirgaceae bacterium SG7u.111]|nr:hypothetical protein [Flammeovirgaceae bacterium SG7u.132]WPO33170.1 hypothetical protein R9C00_15820 [Flammeovirgaceae bacterium SG7u.111]
MDPTNDTINSTAKRKESNDWQTELMEADTFLSTIVGKEDTLARANNAGYSRAELVNAQVMVKEVWAADLVWENKQSEKDQQYKVFKQSFRNLEKEYMGHLTKARRLFESEEDRGIARQLKLEGDRPRKFTLIINYISKFYQFALQEKEISNKLKTRSVSTELVEQMLQMVEEVVELHHLAKKKEKIAQDATTDRNRKLKAFHKWLRDFKAIYKRTPAPTGLADDGAPASSKKKTAAVKA